jgi:hypothetical protein
MEELILVRLNPVELEQEVYIMSNNAETVPLVRKCTTEELPSMITMSAAKYNIHYIKLAGSQVYAEEIRNRVTEKVSTCFGADNDFIIELM